MIQSKIADMALRIEQSRLLIYKAASLKDAGMNFIYMDKGGLSDVPTCLYQANDLLHHFHI